MELLKKGWGEREIEKAEEALEKTTQHDLHVSKIVFWSALVLMVTANLLASLILIPFLIVFKTWLLYSIVILLAGALGFLYNFLIKDIGHLQKKHYLLAIIIVPLIALTNMVIMVLASNHFIVDLKVNNQPHNPYIVAIVFVVAFIIPPLVSWLRRK